MSFEPGQRVVMSERLGPIGDVERQISRRTGAALVSAPLWTEADIVEHGRDADVLAVGSPEPVTRTVLERLPRTRCVIRRGVGVDNVDVDAATEFGIGVAYVPDASVEEVSDHALALLLALERRLFPVTEAVREGKAAEAASVASESRRFGDLTLGIVGFGRIGRALARKARHVFGGIVVTDPVVTAPDTARQGVRLVDLAELLETADLISLHAPATPDTSSLVDANALARTRPGAVLVNTARGELVDEDALLDALARGRLAAVGLDVTRDEPLPSTSPLLNHPKVYLSGHTGSKGQRSSVTLRQAVAAAAVAVLGGERPDHLANPGVVGLPQSRLVATTGRDLAGRDL